MLRTSVFRFMQIGTVALLVLAFAISTAGAQSAQVASSARVSAGWMPFVAGLYDFQTNSNINFSGSVHIITRWKTMPSGGSQVDIQVNLPAVSVLNFNASSVQVIELPDVGED